MTEPFDPASLELALSGAILAASGGAIVPLAAALVRRAFPARPLTPSPFGLRDLLRVVGVVLGLQVLAGLMLAEVAKDSGAWVVALSALTQGAGVALILFWARRRGPGAARSLGLVRGENLRAALASLAAYVLFAPVVMGLAILWPWLLTRLGATPTLQAASEILRSASGPELLALVPLAVIVVPLFEEVIFRGLFQGSLARSLGERDALILTAALFACLHGLSAFLPIFALGLLLGSLMRRTRRLSAPFVAHALHNAVMITLLFAAPDPALPTTPLGP